MSDDYRQRRLEQRTKRIARVVEFATAGGIAVLAYQALPDKLLGTSGFNAGIALLAFLGVSTFLGTHFSE